MAKKTAAGGKIKAAPKAKPKAPSTPGVYTGAEKPKDKFAEQKKIAAKFTPARIEKKRG